MGNYLGRLRVRPPSETESLEERRHPLYYDWSIPKWSPFRTAANEAGGSNPTSISDANAKCAASKLAFRSSRGVQSAEVEASQANGVNARTNNKTHSPKDAGPTNPLARPADGAKSSSSLPGAAIKSAKSTKDALQKNLKATLTSKIDAKSKRPEYLARKSSSGRNQSMSKTTVATLKRIDSTRRQTIEPAEYGGVADQAAIKAATNIHAAKSPPNH